MKKETLIKRLIGTALIILFLAGISMLSDIKFWAVLSALVIFIGCVIGFIIFVCLLIWAFDLD